MSYGDKHLEFIVKGRDTPSTTTKALPMGQKDLNGNTSGMGAYDGLFIYALAGEDIPVGFNITMQHCDAENGAFVDLIPFPKTTKVIPAGKEVVKHPVPFDVKNWVRFKLSSAVETTIVITIDVDKPLIY